jgi:hypothetical protein
MDQVDGFFNDIVLGKVGPLVRHKGGSAFEYSHNCFAVRVRLNGFGPFASDKVAAKGVNHDCVTSCACMDT